MHRHGDAVMLDDLSSAIEPPYGNGNAPRSRQDEFDLAKFGKKPQLKVLSHRRAMFAELTSTAEFQALVHHWADLHINDNVGRLVEVDVPSRRNQSF